MAKIFWGGQAGKRLQRELQGNSRARACAPWSDAIIPQRQVASLPVLIGPRGYAVNDADIPVLKQWVDIITTRCESIGDECPLLDVLEINRLEPAIGKVAVDFLLDSISPFLSLVSLPSGPQHGDLHRGNVLWCDGQLRALDCDRFRVRGIPLLDRIHFALAERMRVSGKRWLPLLLESDDMIKIILRQAGRDPALSSSLLIAYAIDRIANESEGAFLRGRRLAKYATQLNVLFGREVLPT
ncbi:hypothetical protein [Halomonas kalidii]|uniref:Aminoglycoside phosphotransferase domain-containing protein n=1 Tax=Halomonas kalidii TaxID=3043293 RepID=A0ABT6VK76_9GAMM|nr:hypothetical protein [Halomonas kalidii]MDI5934379.1 hypothetical protein [Halomonas kalidii]